MKNIIFIVLLTILNSIVYAVPATSSVQVLNSNTIVLASTIQRIAVDSLIIGPEATFVVDGELRIEANHILISKWATFEGKGKIIISGYQDSDRVLIDGNGNFNIWVDVALGIKGNLILTDLRHKIFEREWLSDNDLFLESNFTFLEDESCVELNGNKFILGQKSNISYISSRNMFSTNDSTTSKLSKHIVRNDQFEFRVGKNKNDVSPIYIKPENDAQLFVGLENVQDMMAKREQDMIRRIWHVNANHNVYAEYVFEHNVQDADDKIADEESLSIQYGDEKQWKSLTTTYKGIRKHSVRVLTSMFPIANQNLFSKRTIPRRAPESKDDYVTVESGVKTDIVVVENDKKGDGTIILDKLKITKYPDFGDVLVSPLGFLQYTSFKGSNNADMISYQIQDQYGSVSNGNVYIDIQHNAAVSITNVFSPNGDGRNDKFVVLGSKPFKRVELSVYNRFGKRVFHSRNYTNNWQGESLDSGTYYYQIKGVDQSNAISEYKGWVLMSK